MKVLLLLGSSKTADVLERAVLVNSIGLPNLAFLARHMPLDDSMPQCCVHHYIWTAQFDVLQQRRSSVEVSMVFSQLPPENGGYGEPNMRQILSSAVLRTADDGQSAGPHSTWGWVRFRHDIDRCHSMARLEPGPLGATPRFNDTHWGRWMTSLRHTSHTARGPGERERVDCFSRLTS